MPGPFVPNTNNHSNVIELRTKEDADNYVRAGWELIETRTELNGETQAVLVYRLGWPIGAGDPVEPPIVNRPSAESGYLAN